MSLAKNNVEKLKGLGVFRTEQARKLGVTPRMLHYYLQKGVLERLSHGQYAFPAAQGFDLKSLLREKLAVAPQAVIGLETALRLYDLTEESPRDIELFVPQSNIPKRQFKDVRLYPIKDELHRKGVQKLSGFPVTSLERTVIDFLRKTKSVSKSLQILNEMRSKGIGFDLSKMKRFASDFRVKGRYEQLMDAFL